MLALDKAGLARWLADRNFVFVANGDAALDIATAIIGVDAAFIALYFSITLIVLTLAAGNLGVRLVDRWLNKGMARLSMAGLAFCLVNAVFVSLAIPPEAAGPELPLGSIAVMLGLQVLNLSMLGVAAHDLGRTMFVDRSIAHIGKEAAQIGTPVSRGMAHPGPWSWTL